MSDITLITPPDKIFNKNTSIFLLYPSQKMKADIQQFLSEATSKFNVYMYENIEDHDIDWILSVHKMSDYVIIELEQLPLEIKQLESFLISHSNTYWLTNGENMYYNKISTNKVYNLDFLKTATGGDKIEKKQ
jgi:hypothetical protein